MTTPTPLLLLAILLAAVGGYIHGRSKRSKTGLAAGAVFLAGAAACVIAKGIQDVAHLDRVLMIVTADYIAALIVGVIVRYGAGRRNSSGKPPRKRNTP